MSTATIDSAISVKISQFLGGNTTRWTIGLNIAFNRFSDLENVIRYGIHIFLNFKLYICRIYDLKLKLKYLIRIVSNSAKRPSSKKNRGIQPNPAVCNISFSRFFDFSIIFRPLSVAMKCNICIYFLHFQTLCQHKC